MAGSREHFLLHARNKTRCCVQAVAFIIPAFIVIHMISFRGDKAQDFRRSRSLSSGNRTEQNDPSAQWESSCEQYIDMIDAVSQGHPPPQLSAAQLTWISSTVRSVSDKPNFLVFGVGFDTPMWQHINCHGRTVFLEQSPEWVKKVERMLSKPAEIHLTKYKGSVKSYNDFFKHPWLIRVPEAVEEACFDVVLIDGPAGGRTWLWSNENPGPFRYSPQPDFAH
jgi:hypothetical protein